MEITIGDYVRPSDSSMQMIGVVAAVRDQNYVVVRWDDRYCSTHSRHSIEFLARPPVRPRDLEQAKEATLQPVGQAA